MSSHTIPHPEPTHLAEIIRQLNAGVREWKCQGDTQADRDRFRIEVIAPLHHLRIRRCLNYGPLRPTPIEGGGDYGYRIAIVFGPVRLG